ncbi:hypothetical protein CAEBREN_18684 [Caenorhabditis brenneri]|uniref:Uncharacterized protein n=1 Tax=Caenorhabditis brenneri TaxID=135651 RepID=G0PCS9_CAEBE|nr:hypothetical protein CAEBREN_18684 [Caenorhabditis brenneri]
MKTRRTDSQSLRKSTPDKKRIALLCIGTQPDQNGFNFIMVIRVSLFCFHGLVGKNDKRKRIRKRGGH